MKALNFEEGVKNITRMVKSFSSVEQTTIVAIAGGSASGKSHLAQHLCNAHKFSSSLSLDDYYLDDGQRPASLGDNYDHPECFDFTLLSEHLHMLRNGENIHKPIYKYNGKRGGYEIFQHQPLIILEGLYTLSPVLHDSLSLRVFIQASEHIRLERRLLGMYESGERV